MAKYLIALIFLLSATPVFGANTLNFYNPDYVKITAETIGSGTAIEDAWCDGTMYCWIVDGTMIQNCYKSGASWVCNAGFDAAPLIPLGASQTVAAIRSITSDGIALYIGVAIESCSGVPPVCSTNGQIMKVSPKGAFLHNYSNSILTESPTAFSYHDLEFLGDRLVGVNVFLSRLTYYMPAWDYTHVGGNSNHSRTMFRPMGSLLVKGDSFFVARDSALGQASVMDTRGTQVVAETNTVANPRGMATMNSYASDPYATVDEFWTGVNTIIIASR